MKNFFSLLKRNNSSLVRQEYRGLDLPTRITNIPGVSSYPFITHSGMDDEFISKEILDTGNWEPFETEVVRRLLGSFDLFVDLGANIGWYTALASNVMSAGGVVHAFEPDNNNFKLLCANVSTASNGVKLNLNRSAVADQIGSTNLYKSASNLGDHQLYGSSERNSEKVFVTTLDRYFGARNLPPRLVKMDTQGSEPRIFKGASNIFSKCDSDSAYIIEFWPYGIEKSGEDAAEFILELSKFPHVPFLIEGWNKILRQTSWEELKQRLDSDLAPNTQHFADLLLLVPGTAAWLAVADLLV